MVFRFVVLLLRHFHQLLRLVVLLVQGHQRHPQTIQRRRVFSVGERTNWGFVFQFLEQTLAEVAGFGVVEEVS